MKYCIIHRDDEASSQITQEIRSRLEFEYSDENPNFVIAVGGDGTILKAFHAYPEAILFGVHTGHLGFYANYMAFEIDKLIEDITSKTFHVEELDVLSSRIISEDQTIEVNAINEVTIVTPARTLILNVAINDEHLERFRGTGICISTPSGSTAYNKSLHGSVIDPKIKCMQMTEIAGINSNAYRTLSSPLVLAYDRVIKLTAEKSQEVFITVDHTSYTIAAFKELQVFYDNRKMKMAYRTQDSFISRITRTFLISKE